MPWASDTLCRAEVAKGAGKVWLCWANEGCAGALCLSPQEKRLRQDSWR